MKNIKIVVACLFVFGSLCTWQAWAQGNVSSGSSNTIYLPWISRLIQPQSISVSTVVSDTASLLALAKEEDYLSELPLPDAFETVTPGQPDQGIPRPPQDELEAMAEIHIPADAPYLVNAVVDHFTDSKASALASDTVIIAKVKTIHPARWNTTDGNRPANPFDFEHPSYIYTLIDIEVQED